MKALAWRIGVLLLLFSALAACGRKEEPQSPEKVTLQLKWVHQAQFAGFYMAREKGFYAEEGLDVSFLEGGNNVDIAQSVLSGAADFGVMSPEDVLIKCSQGEPLLALAAIYRRSAVVYASREGSGIVGPGDFKGKKFAVRGSEGSVRDFELQFQALAKSQALPLSRMELLDYDPSYQGFLDGEVDVTAAYLTGGVIRMRQDGTALNIIWPGDYGVRFYSDVLVATRETASERPGLTERFLRATLKGWEEAIGDPQAAVQATLKYAKIPDPELQTAMMDAQAPLVHTGEDRIGWMKASDWMHMHDILVEQDICPALQDVNSVFTIDFLQKAYGKAGQ